MNRFKHTEYFDYDVHGARSNNCILIDAKNWLANMSNDIVGVNSRGGIANNFITEVLATNITDESYIGTVEAGDIVMMTRAASRMYTTHTFSVPVKMDCTSYTDIPISHIVGKFENRDISLPSFKVLGKYVMLEVLEDIDKNDEGFIQSTNKTTTICKVIQTGDLVNDLAKDDVVLIRDNISTNTMLGGKQFSIVSEDMIIGIFKEKAFNKPLRDVLTLRHNFILMDEYQPEMTSQGSLLALPQYDASQDEGLSAVYSETTYKVILSNEPDILPDDLIYIDRAATSYITVKGIRYYVALNTDYIIATVRGEV